VQPGADRRVKAVRPDEHVGGDGNHVYVPTTGEFDLDLAVTLRETGHGRGRSYRTLAQPVADRRQQDHLQLAAVDGVLRPGVAEAATARLAPDEAAAGVEMRLLGGGDAGRLELPAQSELGELAHRVRQQVDADAERLQRGRGVEQLRLDAGRVQAERGGQARDPGPCDQDMHRLRPFRRFPGTRLAAGRREEERSPG
jgi:hypothetical protein